MDAVPLSPLGERRSVELAATVTSRVESWLRRWAVSGSTASVQREPWEADCDEMPIAGHATGRAGVSLVDAEADAFGAWLAQAPRTGGQGLPARLAAAALDDLRAHLVGAGAKAADSDDRPAKRHWFHFIVSLDAGFKVRVLVDRMLVDRLTPPARAPKRALTPRTEAAAGVLVTCTFALDLGSVPVADVLGLAPGDVLVGQAPLDALLQCRVGESATPNTFQLSRLGRRFAAVAHA